MHFRKCDYDLLSYPSLLTGSSLSVLGLLLVDTGGMMFFFLILIGGNLASFSRPVGKWHLLNVSLFADFKKKSSC